MDKIIKETLAFKELSEEEKQARNILGRLYGPCADFMNPTRNGRKYPDELWEKVFSENELVKEAFDNGGIPGELDHPLDGREEIDSSKIAIIMPEPPKKGKDGKLIAYFDILDTPNGRIAYTLAKYGYKLGISSRGTGDVDEYTDSVIPESYDFKCFDLVLTPSVKDARLSMTEGLNKEALKQALCESLDKSTTKEKKVMEETLERLNINLNEEKEDEEIESSEVEAEEVAEVEAPVEAEVSEPAEEESSEPSETVEKSYDDKIKEFLGLVYDGDTAPTDEETEAFISAFKSIFPEECFSQEGCADIEVSDESEETIAKTEEASDEGSEELIDSLQKTLTEKSELEKQIKELQEQLAVSDNEVSSLKESVEKYKSSMIRLSSEAHDSRQLKVKVNSLEEKLNQKESEIKSLTEKQAEEDSKSKSLTESISNKDKEISSLDDRRKELEAEVKSLNEKLEGSRSKLDKQNSLVEQYKQFAHDAAERYIGFKAKMFGVDKDAITSQLPKEGYTMDDVDTICESLQFNVNKLPFDISKGNIRKVRMTESKNDSLKVLSYVDDEIDDSLLELAKMK